MFLRISGVFVSSTTLLLLSPFFVFLSFGDAEGSADIFFLIYLINPSCVLSFTHDFSLQFLIIILKGRVPEQVLPRSRLQVPAFLFQAHNKWTVGGVIALKF